MSLEFQVERAIVAQYDVKTVTIQTNIYSTIYVSEFKIYETVVRRFITKIISRYVTPDGTEVTRIEVPTSYLETEFVAGRLTRFAGMRPVPIPPGQRREILPQPVPINLAM